INGIAVPAYALDAHRRLSTLLATANCVAASSIVAAALPMDSIDAAVGDVSAARGVADVIKHLQHVVSAHDRRPHKLQAPVSFRIVPQVHGACSDALHDLRQRIEECFCSFSDNPMLVENHQGERKFLSVGVFHNQHLVNQIDHVALAIAHIAALSERRLHRLLDADVTGLSPQLAIRPGLDVGLVVAHKAALESIARIKFLAQPVSLHTGESSGGQEDYMSMAIPAIARLYEMLQSIRQILAAELLAILVALDQRAPPTASHTAAVHTCARRYVQKMTGDRATGADTEALLKLFDSEEWQALSSCDMSASVLSD
ncbi:MAG: aromatic amino acid lyase, partial [Gammaproteobacteria bacterium]|nr:aromatic amino acid lyase [Gammaproteobacteria bacterium]